LNFCTGVCETGNRLWWGFKRRVYRQEGKNCEQD